MQDTVCFYQAFQAGATEMCYEIPATFYFRPVFFA